MSNNIPLKQPRNDENPRKQSSQKPPEQTLRCPRCDSTNTKFCYYNNYNLTQPRYFCKTCRRYWTKGGALRNIPIGGGCRKNKKTKSCTSKTSFVIGGSSSSSGNGFSSPAMDFQLGGMNTNMNMNMNMNNYPHRVVNHQFSSSSSFGHQNNLPFMNLDHPLGFSYTKPDHDHNHNQNVPNFQETGFTYTNLHHNTNLTTSIESLSSLNQDLHWKLQQQRLAMMFGDGSGENNLNINDHHRQEHKESGLQPILFQNLEASRKEVNSGGDGGGGGLATEWFFDNHRFEAVNMNPAAGGNQNGSINNWNGVQDWHHMNHYNAIP
ncbi:hypothetical protein QVD17_18925 [Tagetes erecta]|uniref:Dof zinc finger protein n=1 Tax=Tagetes erecta TaxID=13708 RepID=A0AAD8NWV0_TARER|nr:hypothetical protein QVD17_18925 [Tagetes erecta]